jgi:hypothetical protein
MNWVIDSLILSPFSLISLLALFLPVLIHLFNPAKGRIVYIGNIELLKKLKPSKKLALRINQWILLLIRLIIILLACLLLLQLLFALPIEKKISSKAYVDLNWIKHASEKDKEALFLNHSQSDIHLLQRHLPNLTPQFIDSSANPEFSLDLWVSEIEQQHTANSEVTIYTTNQQNRLLSSTKLVDGGRHIKWEVLAIDSEEHGPKSQQITLYYSPSHQKDMQYMKIAIETLRSIATMDVQLSVVAIENIELSEFKTMDSTNDWNIWLSEEPVAEQILRQTELGSNLLVDIFNIKLSNKAGKDNSKKSNHKSNPESKQNSNQDSFANTQNAKPKISKTLAKLNGTTFEFMTEILANPNVHFSGRSIWKTVKGRTLLAKQSLDKGVLLSLNSRFHPEWTSMVDSTKFPAILSRLLDISNKNAAWKILGTNQINNRFLQTAESSNVADKFPDAVDYQSRNSLIILLLCLFWLLERSLCRWGSVAK